MHIATEIINGSEFSEGLALCPESSVVAVDKGSNPYSEHYMPSALGNRPHEGHVGMTANEHTYRSLTT